MSTSVTGSLCALDKSLNLAKPQFCSKKVDVTMYMGDSKRSIESNRYETLLHLRLVKVHTVKMYNSW